MFSPRSCSSQTSLNSIDPPPDGPNFASFSPCSLQCLLTSQFGLHLISSYMHDTVAKTSIRFCNCRAWFANRNCSFAPPLPAYLSPLPSPSHFLLTCSIAHGTVSLGISCTRNIYKSKHNPTAGQRPRKHASNDWLSAVQQENTTIQQRLTTPSKIFKHQQAPSHTIRQAQGTQLPSLPNHRF